ncbi:exodeoxyribonuclease V subunit alpha [Georgenia sp. 311]|uniref:RecBCD enzyme subunit RecD n=1 Tax=Georgenia wutianyii TaxID=2585135 RepID=A0ABX5VR74_9MICO|nr:exodeoxyribonuclease V subunit alpha [Georgenia wutianyii]TNC17323.1 exodeoxyribonuclease V subunit alpha [Georgenia sp. 311]
MREWAGGPPTDGDARLAIRAPDLLRRHNTAGTVSAADVHVARRLGRLTGEADERVLLAVALAVRAVRGGSVCVRLDELDALAAEWDAGPGPAAELPEPDAWHAAVTTSPLVAVGVDGPADRPARWVDGRLYLDRYWRDEQLVRREVDARLAAPLAAPPPRLGETVRRLFPAPADARQRLATAAAVTSRLTVLTGGPGTGKTTTVARMLAALQATVGPGLRTALAAPTGKAAARLHESVRAELARLGPADQAAVGSPEAMTIHRLLGWRPGSSTRFRHHARHHLPHDVVVVDETSMVSLPLMARLLEALRPDARLVLVGDPDQLASVEAGAVLGDLVARPAVADALPGALRAVLPGDLPADGPALGALRNGVVRLETVHRFEAGIAALAEAVRAGDVDAALGVLRAGLPDVELVEPRGEWPSDADVAGLRADAVAAGERVLAAARAGDERAALAALEEHRLLLAHRRGPAGVAHWAEQVEDWVTEAAHLTPEGPWYLGRPLLVTANDRGTGLYNGDTGVLVADGAGGVVAVLGDPDEPVRVRPHRLPPVETVHAMTVHRAQGSQFATVSLVLPEPASPLLTRELLYTAVTRARRKVRVVGSEEAVRAAVARPVRRASGLMHPQ